MPLRRITTRMIISIELVHTLAPAELTVLFGAADRYVHVLPVSTKPQLVMHDHRSHRIIRMSVHRVSVSVSVSIFCPRACLIVMFHLHLCGLVVVFLFSSLHAARNLQTLCDSSLLFRLLTYYGLGCIPAKQQSILTARICNLAPPATPWLH
jgi:hypothetical protein